MAKVIHRASLSDKKPPTLGAKIAGWVREMDACGERASLEWERRDDLEMKIIQVLGVRTSVMKDGRTVKVRDNFIDPKTGEPRNVAFRPARVKRFEVVISQPKVKKSRADE